MDRSQINLFKEQLFFSPDFQKKWKRYVEAFGEELNGIFGDNYGAKLRFAVGLEHLMNRKYSDAYNELRHFESSCLTDCDKQIFQKLISLCLNEDEMSKIKIGDWVKKSDGGYYCVMKRDTHRSVIKKGFDRSLIYVKKSSEHFPIMLTDLKSYQFPSEDELAEIRSFFVSHPEEERLFWRNTDKMLSLREKILGADFKEALYDFKQFHFYRPTTEKAAFVLNLYDRGDSMEVTYGFTSIPDAQFLSNHGEDDSDIKLRFSATVTNEEDEAAVSRAIKDIYDTYSQTSKDDILALKKERQKQFLQKIAVRLKPLGFKKKAAKWIKPLERGFCLEFEAQKSQWSDEYYFNVNVYPGDSRYPECYGTRINLNGKSLFNWQLMTDEELTLLLDNAIENMLLPIIHTPLEELGKSKEIQKSCFCPGNKCDSCWVQKNS